MVLHSFKKNDRVWIINSTLGGRYMVEGQAVILKLQDGDDLYRVRFLRNGRPQLGEEYDRFVDPQAQADVTAFVAELNRKTQVIPEIQP